MPQIVFQLGGEVLGVFMREGAGYSHILLKAPKYNKLHFISFLYWRPIMNKDSNIAEVTFSFIANFKPSYRLLGALRGILTLL